MSNETRFKIAELIDRLVESLYKKRDKILGRNWHDYYEWKKQNAHSRFIQRSPFRHFIETPINNVYLKGECNNKGVLFYNKCTNTCTCHK